MSQQCYGIVTALDYVNCRVRARLPDRDNIETYWLHLPQTNTLGVQRRAILPAMGEQIAISLDDDGAGGVVVGGVYHEGNPPPIQDADTEYVRFKDGTTVTYNQATHAFVIDGPASITVIAGTVLVQAASATVVSDTVTLDTPNTTCTGNLTIAGSLTMGTGGGATATITGNVQVQGSINATGSIMDSGGNSNHHSH